MIFIENTNQELKNTGHAYSTRNMDKMWGEQSRSDAGTLADYEFFYTPSVNFDTIKLYLDYEAFDGEGSNANRLDPDFIEYRVLSLTEGGALFSESSSELLFEDDSSTLWPLRFKADWAFFPQGILNEENSSYVFRVRHKTGTVRRGDIKVHVKAVTKKVSVSGTFTANTYLRLPLPPQTFHRILDIRILNMASLWQPDISINSTEMDVAGTNSQGYLVQTPQIKALDYSGDLTFQITGY